MSETKKCWYCGKHIENKGNKLEIKSPYGSGVLYMCDSCFANYKQYRKGTYGR